MDGIIIFADDDVLTPNTFENKLYEKLKSSTASRVLPICDLETLEDTVKSMSNFRVLILDWKFRRNIDPKELEGSKIPSKNPMDFLRKTRIYSFIYIYSETELHDWEKDELEELFPNKIDFRTKDSNNDAEEDVKEIIKNVEDFEDNNKHMKVPFKWSQAINQSVQKIFIELEQASPQWIREIYNTAKKDDGDPVSEVINTFGHLLNEALVQDNDLRKSIRRSAGAGGNDSNKQDANREENTAKLYRRIFYSKVTKRTPITTGEIFKFKGGKYGILITPECSIPKQEQLELLLFDEKSFVKCIKDNNFRGVNFKDIKNGKKKDFRELFNQKEMSFHILQSFPFKGEMNNMPAHIDFKISFSIKSKEECKGKRIGYKLNAPYIHQLRQRFVSYFGRYGVSAIPESLTDFYLNRLLKELISNSDAS